MLIPLLGLGLIQQIQCTSITSPQVHAASAAAYPVYGLPRRVTDNGPNLSGLDCPNPAAHRDSAATGLSRVQQYLDRSASTLDPNFRPNVIDAFDFTIQRQLSRKISLEVGYIGRRITHEFQPMALNTVPYMMTWAGSSLSKPTPIWCCNTAAA